MQGPVAIAINNVIRIYFAARDSTGKSYPARLDVAITDPTKITASAGWWGLTLGVLAISAAAIVARRRRTGLDGVKSFRHRYRKGGRR